MQIQKSMKGGYSTYVSRGSGAGGMLQKIFELSRADLDILVWGDCTVADPERYKNLNTSS